MCQKLSISQNCSDLNITSKNFISYSLNHTICLLSSIEQRQIQFNNMRNVKQCGIKTLTISISIMKIYNKAQIRQINIIHMRAYLENISITFQTLVYSPEFRKINFAAL